MSSTQGHLIHSSNCNQEETLKPPILCEGSVADGLQEFSCSSCTRRSFPVWDVPALLCAAPLTALSHTSTASCGISAHPELKRGLHRDSGLR